VPVLPHRSALNGTAVTEPNPSPGRFKAETTDGGTPTTAGRSGSMNGGRLGWRLQ